MAGKQHDARVNPLRDAVDTWRSTVEKQIRTHEDAMQNAQVAIINLKLQLNESLLVSRLPPEILANIFTMVAFQGTDGLWFAFSHVCQRWRAIALDCPMLWSSIDMRWKPDQISSFTGRTKQAPLTVFAHLPLGPVTRPNYDELCEQKGKKCEAIMLSYQDFILPEMSRITKLSLDGDIFIDRAFHEGSTRSLKKLTFVQREFDIEYLPNEYLSKILEAPTLEYLDLLLIRFKWNPNVYHPNLREFHLRTDDDPSWSLAHLLTTLNGMPRLERLVFIRCLPESIQLWEDHADIHVVTLAHLRDILVRNTGVIEVAPNFLSYLDLPCAKNIEFQDIDLQSDSHMPIARVRQLSRLRYGSLHSDGHGRNINLALATDIDVEASSQRFKINTLDWDVIDASVASEKLCKALPLSEVEIFTIHDSPSGRHAIMGFLPSLRILRLCKISSVVQFLDTLSWTEVSTAEAQSNDTIVAQRQVDLLELNGIELPHKWSKDRLIYQHGKPSRLRRFQFNKIVYEECTNLDAEMAALLKEITGAVHDNFQVGDEEVRRQ